MSRDLHTSAVEGAHHEGASETEGARTGASDGKKAGAAAVRRILDAGPKEAGAGGVLTESQHLVINGRSRVVPEGTYVEVVAHTAAGLHVRIYSGFERAEATVDPSIVTVEPQLNRAGGDQHPEPHSYLRYTGRLWNGRPKVEDVAQGDLPDCHAAAAMGAVVVAEPQAIIDMFDPPQHGLPSYRIRLYKNTPQGLVPVWYTVDTYLPTSSGTMNHIAGARDYRQTYANEGGKPADLVKPRWPALVEKALAQAAGGYDDIGGGGVPGEVMEAITGRRTEKVPLRDSDEDLLALLKRYKAEGRPITLTSVEDRTTKQGQGRGFKADGDLFTARFELAPGASMRIVPGTLKIVDTARRGLPIRDNGKSLIQGAGVVGSVDYGSGTLSLNFEAAHRPHHAADLEASFHYKGNIAPDLTLYASHAYIFDHLDADGRVVLKNPWGEKHPKPLTMAQLREHFSWISSTVPAKR